MLSVRNFTKSYTKGTNAVDDLSFDVNAGEICAFIGHNGAGKTTTLKAIAGILDFDAGEILVDGKSVTKEPIYCKSRMAYIPDNPDLYDYLTGVKFLNFIADIYRVPKAEREERIKKYADVLELTPALGSVVGSYSHGMKQKLAVIAALIHHPDLLILDEPFVGLDPIATHNLKNIMHEICDGGGAILFSTHILEVAEKLCDKVVIIKNGKKVADGAIEKVKGDSSLERVFLEISGVENN